MAGVIVVGGSVIGMGLGMLLAADRHDVTILERDPAAPPDSPGEAWDSWERTGVNQFRLPHFFLARYRQVVEHDLPELLAAMERDGALRLNPVKEAPDFVTGGVRDGDDRFDVISGRRAVMERAVASVAQGVPNLTVRRGVAVAGLLCGPDAIGGTPHVTGVRTEDGEELRADVVVDCGGRRSALPAWLAAIDARPPEDQLEDSGFTYYGRHYRSRDGAMPMSLGPGLQEWGSVSSLTLQADNGTWSVVLVARSGDRPLLGLRDIDRFERVIRSMPTVAHWLDGDPIEDRIVTITKIEDRHRDLRPGGEPVATGVLSVADAWACTNPSLGRGASIGMLHAQALRDTLRDVGTDRPAELSEAFAEATERVVEPWWKATLSFDRHRLAEMAALAAGETYRPEDPAFEIGKALGAAAGKDPDVLRASVDVAFILDLPEVVLARPGIMDKVIELGAKWRDEPVIGPTREQLIEMATA